jgi:hypothetical protein
MLRMKAEVVPNCPYCGTPWTPAMLDQYDRAAQDFGCGCCGGQRLSIHDHVERMAAIPAQDLCCATCRRPIYRAPSSVAD